MRLVVSCLLTIAATHFASAAMAQSGDEKESPDAAGTATQAAPIDIDALEPAVDVSEISSRTGPAGDAGDERPTLRRGAVQTLDLGTTSITGNQELPKVLYIVPWKRSDLGDLVGRPVNTLLEEALAPVDPEVFERRLEYYESLYGEGQQE